MTVQLTPAGMRARDIADWAWLDPARNAVLARDRLNVLALSGSLSAQALREVQGYATMVDRLAGTLASPDVPSQAAVTISEQAGEPG
jgi:hypothetical protein